MNIEFGEWDIPDEDWKEFTKYCGYQMIHELGMDLEDVREEIEDYNKHKDIVMHFLNWKWAKQENKL